MAVHSEVGRLRTVLLHRPGDELRRLTPRNNADLLFDGLPWVERAQTEHDAFAALLRGHGVRTRLLTDLLTEALTAAPAVRQPLLRAAVTPATVGPALAGVLHAWLDDLPPEALVGVLTAGLTAADVSRRPALPAAPHRGVPHPAAPRSLVAALTGSHDFLVPPLPNLLFTRDTSVWVGDTAVLTAPASAARHREVSLLRAVYAGHPDFTTAAVLDTESAPSGAGEPDRVRAAGLPPGLEGGDILVLGPGVLAVGVGQRSSPAGVELFAATLFAAGLARVVLAVPIAQTRATMHLDTVCTMVDTDAVVMYPAVAAHLQAWVLTPGRLDGPHPFLAAAADALGLRQLRVIDTGLDPITAEREQWDDGNNTLALAPGVVVGYERNTETNARLADAGITVLAIAGSELGSGRGGPRCMSCPLQRDALTG